MSRLPQIRIQPPAAWPVLAAVLLLSGCGKAQDPWEVVYPTSGVVKYQGQPLAGAIVTFIPQDPKVPKSVRPTAVTDADGAFEIGTYSVDDGAPAGDYKVLVLHYPVEGSEDNPHAGPNDLPPKYSKPDTTDLKVTVGEAETELKPLELE